MIISKGGPWTSAKPHPRSAFGNNRAYKLIRNLPSAAEGRQWVLTFSTTRDGFSLSTFYRLCSTMNLFSVEDSTHFIFSAAVDTVDFSTSDSLAHSTFYEPSASAPTSPFGLSSSDSIQTYCFDRQTNDSLTKGDTTTSDYSCSPIAQIQPEQENLIEIGVEAHEEFDAN
ncbi:unnamed protein product, partial [Protopolystoma xenopodis]